MRPWPPVPHRVAPWLPPFLLALAVAGVVAAVGTPFRMARVSGMVRDASIGCPIPQAQVEAAGAPIPLYRGAFALSLPPGEWVLQAWAPGFGAVQAHLDTRKAYPRRLHLTLALPPLEFAVRVQDAQTSKPLAGAHLQAAGQPCITDDEGLCRWLRLHGPIALQTEAVGFLPAERHLSAAETLHHQQARNALEISLEPRCLRVQVLDGQGGPIPGAQVLAAGREGATNAAGQAAFCRVPATVEVHVQAEGFAPWQGQWQDGGQHPSPLLEVQLSPRRTPGQVLAADLLVPLADARVTVGAREARTAPDGTFFLERLRRGEAGQVTADGYEPLAWTYTGQERLEFRLRPLPTVVQVRDALTGRPVRGAWVGTGAGWAQTDTTGQAALLRVAPGEPVRGHAEGYLPGTAVLQAERLAAAALLPLRLQGTVRDGETGQPIPRARLHTPAGLVHTDEAGRYRLHGYTSPPTVEVLAAGYRKTSFHLDPARLEAAQHAPLEAGRVALRPTEGGKEAELDLLLSPHVVHALYIPLGRLSDPPALRDLLRLAWESDLNGVVVDVKGDKGRLAFRPRNRIAQEAGAFRTDLMDLREVLAFCKEHGLYTVARMVVFKDPVLAAARPEWALRHPDGTLWLDRGGAAWVNPYLQEVWEYNLALAREVADLGFDEIQLDYVRFPSDGQVGAIDYGQESTRETRTAAIRGFVRAFADALEDKAVFTAVDVFGLTVTVHPESDMGIGQRVTDVAPYVDYLCPMVYPSTFAPGNLGLENPYASPYQVVFRSVQEASRRVPEGTRVRPWLQYYFYAPDDLREQMQAAAAAGGWGWMFWNSRANYIFPQVFTFAQAE